MIINTLKPVPMEIDGATVYVQGLPAWLEQSISVKCSASVEPAVLSDNEELVEINGRKVPASEATRLVHVGTALLRAAMRYGVRGWEGITDETGAPVAPCFEHVMHGMEMVPCLSLESMIFTSGQILEIGTKVMDLTHMSRTAKKKSGAPSVVISTRGNRASRRSGSPAKDAASKSKGAAGS